MLEGISRCEESIYIINYNESEVNLYRDIPFAPAEVLEEEHIGLIHEKNVNISLEDPKVFTMMAISSITETAYVSSEEYLSDTDDLQEALKYDPAEISTDPVIYDEDRFQKLLKVLKPENWSMTNSQRRKAEKVLRLNQKSFNLEGEPLPKTHLIKHDIVLKNEEETVFVKPRWTPMAQREPIEREMEALWKHDLIEPSTSGFSSPVVLVKKKDRGKFRLAVDYRFLNS